MPPRNKPLLPMLGYLTDCKRLMLSLVVACVLSQGLMPTGFMPGNLATGQSLFVLCGYDGRTALVNSSGDIVSYKQESNLSVNHDIGLCVFSAFLDQEGSQNHNTDSSALLFRHVSDSYLIPIPPNNNHYVYPPPRAPPIADLNFHNLQLIKLA